MVGLTGIRSISRPPLKVQKVGGLYPAREGGRETVRVKTRGERARTPRAAVTAGTTSAMRQPTAFNVALRRPVVAPGTICRLANAGGTGVAILRTRPLAGPRNTVSRLGTHGEISMARASVDKDRW